MLALIVEFSREESLAKEPETLEQGLVSRVGWALFAFYTFQYFLGSHIHAR